MTTSDDRQCKPGGCSAIGCEGGHYCFDEHGQPRVNDPQKLSEVLSLLKEQSMKDVRPM